MGIVQKLSCARGLLFHSIFLDSLAQARETVTTNDIVQRPQVNRLCLAGVFCALAVAAAGAGPKAPGVPLGWKGEIILESPTISAPSMICASPDGRLFMGEDFVDMGAPSDAAADKVVAIYPDGQILVFATNLHAVFGLKYIDGKVYVHHTPKFSVFDDLHGVGANRVDIITNDNPHPWLPSFNDHIPSGFGLAMDGYFYVSTGDKGVYNAVGADGRKLTLRGGVYRMRPDGTGLEAYCSGTRNHLNVAINSEDEMFTFDNTDDGGGWWERVTHMVDGGFYGYPFDFKPQRPYTLWCMADYGGGAPTDICCYTEDALPDEYKDNVFMCDWSGCRVYRLKVRRDGATYKIIEPARERKSTSKGPPSGANGEQPNWGHDYGAPQGPAAGNSVEQFAIKDSLKFITQGTMDDFRPVGICVSPDGKSFYVTDWGHSYWKRNEQMGRLIKVTYTGKTQETPKPAWYLPAATGEPFQATTAELVRGLMHPAESVRLVAQRRLAERGRAAMRGLLALMKDSKAPSYARWFAIWTLDAIDGGKKERKAIIAALKDKDETVEMQAARQLGTRTVRPAASALTALLHRTNAAVRFRASTALGRIGDPAAVPALFKELDQKDLFARYAAFLALRRIGQANPKAWPRIVQGLANTNPAIRQGVEFAVRETYDPELVKALAEFSRKTNLPLATRTNVFGLLSSLSQEPERWNGDWWNTMPVNGTPPPKNVRWAGTLVVASALRAACKDPEVAIRKIGIEWVHSSHDPQAAAVLAELFQHETNASTRAAILRELSAAPSTSTRAVITSILQDPRSPAELLQAAVEAGGKMEGKQWDPDFVRLADASGDERLLTTLFEVFGAKKITQAIPLLTANLSKPSPALRQHARDALVHIGGPSAIESLTSALNGPTADMRREAIDALAAMKAKSALSALIKCAAAPDTHDAAVTALTQMPNEAALDLYLEGLASKNYSLRGQCESALRVIRQAALPLIETKLATTDLPEQAISILRQIYAGDPAAKKSALLRRKILEIPLAQYQDFALAHTGDSRRGRGLFHDLHGVACVRCHRINGEGADIGPDLTGIRTKYPRSFIVESVLYPSKQILDGYQQVNFETKDGEDISGIVRDEHADELTVIDSGTVRHVLKKSDIVSRKISQISLMPEGLQTGLTLAEFSDLISYVENPLAPGPAGSPGQPFSPKGPGPAPANVAGEAAAPAPEPASNLFSFLDVGAPSWSWSSDSPPAPSPAPAPRTTPPPGPAPAPPRVAPPPPAPAPKAAPPKPVAGSGGLPMTNDLPPVPPMPPMPPGWTAPTNVGNP